MGRTVGAGSRRIGCEKGLGSSCTGGLDELATNGSALVSSLQNGEVSTFEVTPADAGLETCNISELQGGDAEYNATALVDLLEGKRAPTATR